MDPSSSSLLVLDSSAEPSSDPKIISEEEIEFHDRPDTSVSHWWKTLISLSLFIATVGGIITATSMGDISSIFAGKCILYAKVSLRNVDWVNKTLTEDNIVEVRWGSAYDCDFCQFAPLFSTVFGGMLFAMFLQCGRGGVTSKGGRRSYQIVPPAVLITITFFIVAAVILGKTLGGLSSFCYYILRDQQQGGKRTCGDVFSLHFPSNYENLQLYTEYVLVQVGAVLMFSGWLVALTVLLLRVLLGIDFIAYQRIKLSSDPADPNNFHERGQVDEQEVPDDDSTDSDEVEETFL